MTVGTLEAANEGRGREENATGDPERRVGDVISGVGRTGFGHGDLMNAMMLGWRRRRVGMDLR